MVSHVVSVVKMWGVQSSFWFAYAKIMFLDISNDFSHFCGNKFTYWSMFFAPALLGNAAVFMLPERAAGYFGNTIFAPVCVEVVCLESSAEVDEIIDLISRSLSRCCGAIAR